MKNKKQPLLNTYVNNVNMTETIELIDELLEAKKKSYVLAVNVDVIMKMENDKYLNEIESNNNK